MKGVTMFCSSITPRAVQYLDDNVLLRIELPTFCCMLGYCSCLCVFVTDRHTHLLGACWRRLSVFSFLMSIHLLRLLLLC